MKTKHLPWYKKLSVIITISLLPLGLLSGISCTFLSHSDSTYTPKVINDGTGGAIAVYEEVKSSNERDFYAQRISPDGKTLWSGKGTLIGSNQSASYSFPVFDIAGDGTGGAIIGWPDFSPNQSQSTKQVTKIDSNGNILWRSDFANLINSSAMALEVRSSLSIILSALIRLIIMMYRSLLQESIPRAIIHGDSRESRYSAEVTGPIV
jgi:hypothetical protein